MRHLRRCFDPHFFARFHQHCCHNAASRGLHHVARCFVLIGLLGRCFVQTGAPDMLTLKGLNWLNDNVINGYLSLIVERSKAGQGAPPRAATAT